MRCLGVDRGEKRTGIAVSDSLGIMATPVSVIENSDENLVILEILTLADRYEVDCIIVGMPRSLNGELGVQALKVASFVEKLTAVFEEKSRRKVEIKTWDERFSTTAAQKSMSEAGMSHRKSRKHIDSLAATYILQHFLDSEKKD